MRSLVSRSPWSRERLLDTELIPMSIRRALHYSPRSYFDVKEHRRVICISTLTTRTENARKRLDAFRSWSFPFPLLEPPPTSRKQESVKIAIWINQACITPYPFLEE